MSDATVNESKSKDGRVGHRFGDGNKFAVGRPKGVPNKTTILLKDVVLKAAMIVGEDGKGKDGLLGYVVNLARTNPSLFVPLLAKILPIQLQVKSQTTVVVITPDMSMEQAERAYSETLRVAYDANTYPEIELQANEEEPNSDQ